MFIGVSVFTIAFRYPKIVPMEGPLSCGIKCATMGFIDILRRGHRFNKL